MLNEKLDLLGHTDCFVVSGGKVIKGINSYLVIAVGLKSFKGCIIMGAFFVPLTFMFSDEAMGCSVTL